MYNVSYEKNIFMQSKRKKINNLIVLLKYLWFNINLINLILCIYEVINLSSLKVYLYNWCKDYYMRKKQLNFNAMLEISNIILF